MATIHAVLNLDAVAGTKNEVYLKSAKFYSGDSAAAVDNAALVVLGDKLDRNTYKCTAPSATSVASDILLVAGVELFYDQTNTHYLTEWENVAGKAVRLIKLVPGADTISVTAEGLNGTPAVGSYVGFAASTTKMQVQSAKDGKTIGKIVAKETSGKYTFWVIDICEAGATAVSTSVVEINS